MSKVSVIGAGNVGAAIVNAMTILGVANEILLFNRKLKKAEAEAWDIMDSIPLLSECEIKATDRYEDLKRSDVVVVTVGAKQREGESRLDLLKHNGKIISDVITKLDKFAPDAVIILVSNPVDILTKIAIETSKRDSKKIFGSGTILDTARLRAYLGRKLGVNRKNIHAHVVGEHGDSEFVLWSNAFVSSIKLEKYETHLDLEKLKVSALKHTRNRAYKIIERKGYTSYGIGVSTAKLVKSILRDEQKVLSVSTLAHKEYSLGRAVLSLPCVIGKDGINRQLVLNLDTQEEEQLEASAESLTEAFRELEKSM